MNATDWRNRAFLAEERLERVNRENEELRKEIIVLNEKPAPVAKETAKKVTKKATKKAVAK